MTQRQAGGGDVRCGEGVLADAALIGLPEIVPIYWFAAVTVARSLARLPRLPGSAV